MIGTFQLKNGMQLQYEDVGNGDPVVMLHGWTSSRTVFSEPVRQLAHMARFITVDFRGHGGSKAANREPVTVETLANDLNELLEGLSLHEVTLLGWSMGASTALTYIDQFGCSRLKQLILCDMTPKKVNDDTWNLGLYKGAYTASDQEQDKHKDIRTLFREYALHAVPRYQNVPKLLLSAGLQKQLKGCDETVIMSLFHAMNTQDLRSCVGKITVPLTYFYSEPGSLYSPALADWYRDQVNVPFKAVAFPDSTHMFISEYPKEFAEALATCETFVP